MKLMACMLGVFVLSTSYIAANDEDDDDVPTGEFIASQRFTNTANATCGETAVAEWKNVKVEVRGTETGRLFGTVWLTAKATNSNLASNPPHAGYGGGEVQANLSAHVSIYSNGDHVKYTRTYPTLKNCRKNE